MSESKSASVVFTNSSLLAKNAQVTADSAKTAAEVAQNQAITAQKTADGKNSIYRGTDPNTIPTSSLKAGDLYFTDNALYTWTGSTCEKTVSDTTGQEIHAKVEEAMAEKDKAIAELESDVNAKVKQLDDQIKETSKQARLAPNLPEKLKLEREKRQLETKRDEAWRAYEVAAREIEHRKDALMDEVEKKMAQHITEQVVFTIRWRLQ